MQKLYKKSKDYFIIATPLVLGNLIEILIPTTDTLMVGHLGKHHLAAAELVNSISLVAFIFLVGISHGLVPRVAALVADSRYKQATHFLKHSLLLNAVVGTALCTLMIKLAPVLYYLKQDPQVAKRAVPYLYVIATSIIPDMVFMTLIRYLEGVARTRVIFYTSLLTCVSNITLNYIFIYGKFGLPAMGLLGAGWGTLATRVLNMIVVGFYIFYAPSMRRYVVSFTKVTFSLPYFSKLLKIGLPIALHYLLEVAATALSVLMIGWVSVEAQAANAIVRSIISFGNTITWSFSTAASILVGRQLGKGSGALVRSTGLTCFIIAGLVALGISLLLVSIRSQLLLLYGPEEGVLKVAQLLILLVALHNVFDSIYTVGMGTLRGIEDTLIPFILTTIIHWFIGLPISYLLAFPVSWGAAGIWWGSIASFALSAIALASRFYLKSNPAA